MGVISIENHPSYIPLRTFFTNKLLRLWNGIKRDISRIISLSNQESSDSIQECIFNCRERIFERLESITEIRKTAKIQPEAWNKILESALSNVYKHSDSEQIYTLLQSLLMTDEQDISHSGIHFLQEYMRIVARIPESQIIIPFKP
jgi:hypothetical protein